MLNILIIDDEKTKISEINSVIEETGVDVNVDSACDADSYQVWSKR